MAHEPVRSRRSRFHYHRRLDVREDKDQVDADAPWGSPRTDVLPEARPAGPLFRADEGLFCGVARVGEVVTFEPPRPETMEEGALALHIRYCARALRETGIPVGPGAVLDALAAVEATGFGEKADFRQTLHAVFVKKHEHTLLFDPTFEIFWRRKGFVEKLLAMMSPQARPDKPQAPKAEAGATRVSDAFFKPPADDAK